MPNPSSHQANFLGGEWSLTAQGRLDRPQYKTALNVAENCMPLATGAIVRRAGLEFLGPTYGRGTARLMGYRDIGDVSYLIALTVSGGSGYAHFYSGTAPVFTSGGPFTVSSSSSSAGILTIVTSSSTGWAVGDQVKFSNIVRSGGGAYANRVLTIKTISTTTITLWDDMGIAFSFDSTTDDMLGASVQRLLRSTTAFTATTYFDKIRSVQAQTPTGAAFFIIERHTAPQVITGTNLAISTAVFKDGPYLDNQGTFAAPETGTVSAYTGSITFTPATTTFVAADVGRLIRLWSEPAAWASGTTYTYGQTVTFNGQFWKSMAQGAYASLNVGIQPGTVPPVGTNSVPVSLWAPDPTAGRWAWGTITAQATTSCTVLLTTDLNSVNGTTISKWRLGLFMAGRYPACGVFHEGRLWFAGCASGADAGAPQGRFDASTSDDIYTFSPTDIYGNVADNHAINFTLASKRSFDGVRWMEVTDAGNLLFGAPGLEWLVDSVGDGMTPTTTKATEVTEIGSAEVEPVRAGISLIFVQRYGRTVYEYLADAVSNRFGGRPINEDARHLVASASDDAAGFSRLAYQPEKVPIIWAVAGGNALLGCTYRRTSRYIDQPPEFEGWHRQLLYDGMRLPVDVCTIPGTPTAPLTYLVTQENGVGIPAYSIEVLRPLMDGES